MELRQAARSPRLHMGLLAGAYLLTVAGLLLAAGRPFAYPLDDTYIHMALARTIATAHVWGVTPGEPAAASSSPLWSVILAALDLVVPDRLQLYIPLVLNALFGLLLIVLLGRSFERRPGNPVLPVLAVVGAVALPSLTMLGMEHVLHILLALFLCISVCSLLTGSGRRDATTAAIVFLLAFLCVAARYESLFLVGPLVLLALVRKNWPVALALAAGAVAAVGFFGWIYIREGGWLLPNSLILKKEMAGSTGATAIVADIVKGLKTNLDGLQYKPAYGVLVLGILALLARHRRKTGSVQTAESFVALAALMATAGHLVFASVGWLYRYESWLIALDVLALLLLARRSLEPRESALVAVIALVLFLPRTGAALHKTTLAIDDRRQEHLYPAEILARHYGHATVMVNDLGAAAWFAPTTDVLDVFGLGSNVPVRFMMSGTGYRPVDLDGWAKRSGAKIAVLQSCWNKIAALIPPSWRLVGLMTVPRNVVFVDRLVGFYAIDPAEDGRLADALKADPPPKASLNLAPTRNDVVAGCPTQ